MTGLALVFMAMSAGNSRPPSLVDRGQLKTPRLLPSSLSDRGRNWAWSRCASCKGEGRLAFDLESLFSAREVEHAGSRCIA